MIWSSSVTLDQVNIGVLRGRKNRYFKASFFYSYTGGTTLKKFPWFPSGYSGGAGGGRF